MIIGIFQESNIKIFPAGSAGVPPARVNIKKKITGKQKRLRVELIFDWIFILAGGAGLLKKGGPHHSERGVSRVGESS